MKILDSNSFIKEGYMNVTCVVNNTLELNAIDTTCKWDGEHWYFYEREGNGDIDDFRKLDNNRNTNFEVYLKFDFSLKGDEMGEVGKCRVSMMVNVHYMNMAEDDYEIEVRTIDDMDEFNGMLYGYDIDTDELKKVLSESWDEFYVYEKIGDELEDRIGLKRIGDKSEKLCAEIKDKAIEGFLDEYANE